jgi:hypothetical protein
MVEHNLELIQEIIPYICSGGTEEMAPIDMYPCLEEENWNQPNFSKDSIEEIPLMKAKKKGGI